MANLEVSELLANSFEPKRKFRWVLSINGIEAFLLKTAMRPHVVFEETVIDYINQKRYVSGKGAWEPITIVLHDPIAPSASQKVMEWIRLNWENTTGRMGYASMYKQNINLKMLDGQGSIVEDWTLQGAWISDANFGDLDYSVNDNADITVNIRFDQAVLNF